MFGCWSAAADAGLAGEALAEALGLREVRRDDLDGGAAAQVQVLGAVDHAHPAAPDPLLDPVARDHGAQARVIVAFRHHAPDYGRHRRHEAPAGRGRHRTGQRPARCAGPCRARFRWPARAIPRRSRPPSPVTRRPPSWPWPPTRRRCAPGSTRSALGAGPEVVAVEELTDAGWDAAAGAPARRAHRSPPPARPPGRARVARWPTTRWAGAGSSRQRPSTRCAGSPRRPSTATTTRPSTPSASATSRPGWPAPRP